MNHKKTNGTVTITGADGRIVGNLAGEAFIGPDGAPVINISLFSLESLGGVSTARAVADAADDAFWEMSREAAHEETQRYVLSPNNSPMRLEFSDALGMLAEHAPNSTMEQRVSAARHMANLVSEPWQASNDCRDDMWVGDMEAAVSRWDWYAASDLAESMACDVAYAEQVFRVDSTVDDLAKVLPSDATRTGGNTGIRRMLEEYIGDWGMNWSYEERDFLTPSSSRMGFLNIDNRHSLFDVVDTVRRCQRLGEIGPYVYVDSVEDFDCLLSVLPYKDVSAGRAPLPVRFSEQARAQVAEAFAAQGFVGDEAEDFLLSRFERRD